MKITHQDENKITPAEVVGTAKVPIYRMWRRMEFYLQDKLVSRLDANYQYQAYMEYITSTSEEEQIKPGESMPFQKDSPGIFHNMKRVAIKLAMRDLNTGSANSH